MAGFDLTALTEYVDEQRFPLLTKAQAGSKTAGLMEVMSGVKGKTKLNILDTTAHFQDGTGCGFNASGDTTFTQREIDPGFIKVNETYCDKDLKTYYTRTLLSPGTEEKEEFAPGEIEASFAELKAQKIANQIEKAIWQGDTTSGDPDLNKFDGLLKIADDSGSALSADTSGSNSAITQNSILDIVDDIYTKLPVAILDRPDNYIFMGYDDFRTYTKALKDQNLFHYDSDHANFELTLPGTTVTVKAVDGLTNQSRIFATYAANLYRGVDMEDEEEDFEFWYSKDDRNTKFAVEFTYGVQIAFPEHVVTWQ